MSGFRNILVGIDLSRPSVSSTGPHDPVAACTVQHALWLAQVNAATLTFMSVFPHSVGPSDDGRQALDRLVAMARGQGVAAHAALAVGQHWAEIVLKVCEDDHDLLVIGTHDLHGLRHLLLGSTARKLLHECPCPVWVSKIGTPPVPRRILVASDLTPLSDIAVNVAVNLGHVAHAHTHLLDVVEYRIDRFLGPYPSDLISRQYHERIRARANAGLHAQVEHAGATAKDPAITVHVAAGDGIPDHAIVKFIREHNIDLLVLGTASRSGFAALLQGNTAERLLPEVPCSVLAVKPADFNAVVPASND